MAARGSRGDVTKWTGIPAVGRAFRISGLVMIVAAVLQLPLHATASGSDQPVTVAALGNSLVQGFGLPREEGFTVQLENWLRDRNANALIMNAGVSGDTTAGGLARIDWTIGSDVSALIVVLGGNDVLRGIDPEVSRRNLRGILEAASRNRIPVLLVGHEVPDNYGPDYKRDFEAIYRDLAAEFGTLFHERFFAALEDGLERHEAARRFMQDDGLHPNADGVRLIVESIGPQVLELVEISRDRLRD